jgi:hypothetical protein
MSFSRGVDLVPKKVFLASSRGTARRAYVGEPVARGVLSCPLCHGRNVEAVEPEAGRGVNEIG